MKKEEIIEELNAIAILLFTLRDIVDAELQPGVEHILHNLEKCIDGVIEL